jgi:hypothetical protein
VGTAGHVAPIADYALVNPHDAEVSESVQITQFRTVGSAGTSPTGMSCRGEQAGGAHGTLVLLSRETELEIVRVIDTPEATHPIPRPEIETIDGWAGDLPRELNPRRPH